MIRNESIKAISEPEFIDVVPQNDLISKCIIKVLYLGQNRNGSYIDKETAKKMANTLGGSPIVARYLEDKDDFGDHGRSITLEDGEIKVSCNTVPYGFVAPDAEVWFQEFVDIDKEGRQTTREYMMTTGYLWTGQYPEIQKAIDEGMPQSMELDEDSLDGQWVEDSSGYEIFIVNDAKFSKLCILGSDVEPCFEGASVAGTGEKEPVKLFAKDDTPEFVRALLKMREQLTYALHNEGGLDNVKQEKVVEEVEQAVITDFDDASDSADSSTETASIEEGTEADDETAPTVEDSDTQEDEPEEDSEEESEALISSDVDESIKKLESDSAEEKEASEGETDFAWQTEVQEVVTEIKTTTDEFIPAGETEGDKIVSTKVEITETNRVVTDREVDDEPGETTIEPEEAPAEEAPVVLEAEDAEDSLKEVEAQFAAVNQELEEVKVQFANLQADYDKALDELEALRSFKLEIENKEKDAEIAKYFMLSDEDKAEVIAHKSEYTLAEIQSKLAVLYVEKNVDFNTLGESEVEEKAAQEIAPITTFSLDAPVDSTFNAPEWVQALIDRQ